MKLNKVIILLLLSIFVFSSTVSAASYQLSETKHITINETITITKRPSDKVTNFYIKRNLINDVNTAYADPYEYVVTNKQVSMSKDSHNNYSFQTTLKELTDTTTTFNIVMKSKSSFVDYNINPSNVSSSTNYPSNVAKYLSASDKIESNHSSIIQKGKEIVGNETNPYHKAKKIFDFTYMNMSYDINNGNYSALHALQTKVGVCEDYARLMIALLRSQDIPARAVSGYRIQKDVSSGTLDISSGQYNHMWVEFYLNGYGWVPADPTITFAGEKFITDKFFTNLDSYYFPLSIEGQLNGTSFNYNYPQGQAPDLDFKVSTKATFSASSSTTPPTPKPPAEPEPEPEPEPTPTPVETKPQEPVSEKKESVTPSENQDSTKRVNPTNIDSSNKSTNDTNRQSSNGTSNINEDNNSINESSNEKQETNTTKKDDNNQTETKKSNNKDKSSKVDITNIDIELPVNAKDVNSETYIQDSFKSLSEVVNKL